MFLLGQVNNDIQVALDVLSNPMANAVLQQHLATVKQASNKRTRPSVVRPTPIFC